MLTSDNPPRATICIMLVEDHHGTALTLSRMLTQYYDQQCTVVSSCEEALQHLHTQVDLWVVDVCFPCMSGLELVRLVRAHERSQRWKPQYIVVMSGDENYKQAAEDAGCTAFVHKFDRTMEQITRICVAVAEAKVSAF